jgi:hypothetical protein
MPQATCRDAHVGPHRLGHQGIGVPSRAARRETVHGGADAIDDRAEVPRSHAVRAPQRPRWRPRPRTGSDRGPRPAGFRIAPRRTPRCRFARGQRRARRPGSRTGPPLPGRTRSPPGPASPSTRGRSRTAPDPPRARPAGRGCWTVLARIPRRSAGFPKTLERLESRGLHLSSTLTAGPASPAPRCARPVSRANAGHFRFAKHVRGAPKASRPGPGEGDRIAATKASCCPGHLDHRPPLVRIARVAKIFPPTRVGMPHVAGLDRFRHRERQPAKGGRVTGLLGTSPRKGPVREPSLPGEDEEEV